MNNRVLLNPVRSTPINNSNNCSRTDRMKSSIKIVQRVATRSVKIVQIESNPSISTIHANPANTVPASKPNSIK